MTNEDSPEPRLSKFSNADRGAYRKPQPDRKLDEPPLATPPGNDAPLADLLEHVIRDSGLNQRGLSISPQGAEQPQILPDRLIEELSTAQEQARAEAPPAEYRLDTGAPAPDEAKQAIAKDAGVTLKVEPRRASFRGAGAAHRAGRALAESAQKAIRNSGQLARRMRIRDWRRRRLALLSLVHRHVFDRNTEKLLFSKTPPSRLYQLEETGKGVEKSFIYEGPIPRKLLDWALSALPADLKRYAFIDFRAGNGRTLLLAARRNFEYAAGYTFDVDPSEELEMNLAQYPRSYLSCRDVRALRGDRDGVVIPLQPVVLFFPDKLSSTHLDLILSYAAASSRIESRPIYLIFENAGRERGHEQLALFEKVPLPLLNQAKAFLFAPVSIAVYRSKTENPD